MPPCACGHPHEDDCHCGCTIWEPDVDGTAKTIDMQNAYRWDPRCEKFANA